MTRTALATVYMLYDWCLLMFPSNVVEIVQIYCRNVAARHVIIFHVTYLRMKLWRSFQSVPLEILGSSPGCVVTGRPVGRRTIGPALSGLGEGLADRDVLVPSRSSDSCGAGHSDTVSQVYCVFSDALVRLTSRLSGHYVKKQCGLFVFRRMHGSRPSPLQSPYGSCNDGTRL
jgi:hypothetical protein